MIRWDVLLPEMLLMFSVAGLLLGRIAGMKSRHAFALVFGSYALCLGVLLLQGAPEESYVMWADLMIYDRLTHLSKCLIAGLGLLFVVFASDYMQDESMPAEEMLLLVQLQAIGMMALVASGHWISIFVSMELSVLPVYALVVLRREDKKALEAGVKYMLMGIVATALMVYGVSVVYSLVGSLRLGEIAEVIHQALDEQPTVGLFVTQPQLAMAGVLLGVSCILVAFAFKIGLFPFHFWVADMYEGASQLSVMWLGSVPKWTFLVLWIRVFAESFAALVHYWQWPVMAMAAISLFMGHFWALSQSHVRRMFGFASVAQMGYVFLGLGLASPAGTSASMGYMLGYVLTSFFAFALLSVLRMGQEDVQSISSLVAWARQDLFRAIGMLVALFSFVGVPPLLGFMIKLQLIAALVGDAYYFLAGFAMLMSVVGAAYYLNIVKIMFFEDASVTNTSKLTIRQGSFLAITCTFVIWAGVLWLGIMPDIWLRPVATLAT